MNDGSIPACAGEPYSKNTPNILAQVYPRVCGGTCIQCRRNYPVCGLSPRVRGNQHVGIAARPLARSIPACAGEPLWPQTLAGIRQVYPRVCGGTVSPLCYSQPSYGLSPRVRGNLRVCGDIGCPDGSIPACAGEPHGGWQDAPFRRVYPRVCGGTLLQESS